MLLTAVSDLKKLFSHQVQTEIDRLIEIVDNRHQKYYEHERKAAAYVLGRKKIKKAVPALLEALKTDPSFDVKEVIIEALGEIGDKRAVGILAEIAKKHENWGPVETFQYGSEILQEQQYELSFGHIFKAIAALGQIGDETAVVALGEILNLDPDPKVRIATVNNLADVALNSNLQIKKKILVILKNREKLEGHPAVLEALINAYNFVLENGNN